MRIMLCIAALCCVLFGSSFRAVPDDCPAACPPYDCSSVSGTIPTGVTVTVLVGHASPGTGTEICATCGPCKKPASVNINGNGTEWCVVVDYDGSGWSAPMPRFNRGGTVSANCDDLAYYTFAIVLCGGGPAAYTYTLCLNCGCDA